MIGRLSDIDFRLLRIFVAVVESGSFSIAATRLNVSESTVSSHMSDLERRLDMRLCERGRAGFRLTDNGEDVYRATTELLEEATRFRDRLSTLRSALGGTLKLGLPDSIVTHGSSGLMECLKNYTARAPDVSLELLILTPRELERGVLDGSLHVALGAEHRRVSGLKYHSLFTEQNYLYCGRDHPFYGLADKAIDAEMLDKARRISRGYLERFDEKFFSSPVHRATVHHIESAALLILTGQFVGFLPDHYARAWEADGRMRAIKKEKIVIHSPISILTRRDAAANLRVAAFIQDMCEAAAAT
jgi:LysR family transcriptional regulator, transcriptional activator for bauABCD operon